MCTVVTTCVLLYCVSIVVLCVLLYYVCIVVLCVYCCTVCVLLYCVYCCTVCVLLYCVSIAVLYTVVAGMLARSQHPEGPATGHLGKGFLGFPVSVYKRMLRWFPRLQVATACFSCSSPDLNFLVTYFISMYMRNNHCHRATAQLQ